MNKGIFFKSKQRMSIGGHHQVCADRERIYVYFVFILFYLFQPPLYPCMPHQWLAYHPAPVARCCRPTNQVNLNFSCSISNRNSNSLFAMENRTETFDRNLQPSKTVIQFQQENGVNNNFFTQNQCEL
jgi:hypothetical protein